MSLALVLLFAALQPPPLAEDTEFVEGVRLYNELEFEQAIFRFQKAALAAQARAPGDRAEVFLWLGLSYAGLGDFESAERSFRDSLSLAPDLGLPAKASPKVSELLEAVRARVKEEQAAAAAPPPEPPPAAAPPEPAPPSDGPWLLVGAGALGAAGAGALVGAGVLAVLAGQSLVVVNDPDAFQDETKAAEDAANLQIALASGLAGVGALLVVAAATLLAFDLVE